MVDAELTTRTVGHGSGSVYVYYFQTYVNNTPNYYWPCKIGMTMRDATVRINEQTKTALPEAPVIGLIIKTDDAALLEATLHDILRLKHRDIQQHGGTEWYNTTPDEVLTLCELLRAI